MQCCKSQAATEYSFANFRVYLLKESRRSRQEFYKLPTNIPQLIECGDFCKIISTPIKCILEELLFLGLLFLNGNKMSKNCKFQ